VDSSSAAHTWRWKGWRTEFVGLRAFLWIALASTLELAERGLHRLVTQAVRRYTVRVHEYDVRCRRPCFDGECAYGNFACPNGCQDEVELDAYGD
jgi:hypothetical protein